MMTEERFTEVVARANEFVAIANAMAPRVNQPGYINIEDAIEELIADLKELRNLWIESWAP
jgi:hypothetical protein